MKKKYINILFVLAAAMLSAACGKEPLSGEQEGFSVSINANLGTELEHSTRTSLSGASTLWTAGDQISVNGNSLTLVSGEGTGAATFKATFSGKGAGYNEYLAGYPAASTVYTPGGTGAIGSLTVTLPDEQTYDPTSTLLGQMPMAAFGKADSNGNLALNFKNAANILKVKLWNTSGRKVTKIEIIADNSYLSGTYTVTPNGNDNVTISDLTGASRKVTLTCPTAVSVGSTAANATVFHVLLPKIETEGTVLTFRIYDEAGYYQTKTMTVGASHLLHTHAHNYIAVTVANEFVPTIPAGLLPGEFTVNDPTPGTPGDERKVSFSPGNLQYIGSSSTPYFKFADHQWDIIGGSSGSGQFTTATTVDRDLFGWGTSGYDNKHPYLTVNNNSNYYNAGDIAGTNYDWGQYNAIYNPSISITHSAGIWRTMTSAEWTYLLSTRKVTVGGEQKITYFLAQVKGVNGMIILPDNWDGHLFEGTGFTSAYGTTTNFTSYQFSDSTTPTWSEMEESGVVFLPACGARSVSGTNPVISVSYVGSRGAYWTSSNCSTTQAYSAWFAAASPIATSNTLGHQIGYGVRLVRNATSSSQVSTTDFELEPSVINW